MPFGEPAFLGDAGFPAGASVSNFTAESSLAEFDASWISMLLFFVIDLILLFLKTSYVAANCLAYMEPMIGFMSHCSSTTFYRALQVLQCGFLPDKMCSPSCSSNLGFFSCRLLSLMVSGSSANLGPLDCGKTTKSAFECTRSNFGENLLGCGDGPLFGSAKLNSRSLVVLRNMLLPLGRFSTLPTPSLIALTTS